MTNKSNPFKAMVQARTKTDAETDSVPKPEEKTPNKQVIESPLPLDLPAELESEKKVELKKTTKPTSEKPSAQPKKRGRGRPATGKRSDPGWIGRTYYVREETDIDIELELAMLRRQGVDMDKSELVDSLLSIWVKWRQGENSNILLGEISPMRNTEIKR